MAQTDLKTLIDVTSSGGESFVKDAFYKVFDTKREEIYRFYRDKSVVIWNGGVAKGLQAIMELYKSIPTTIHRIESLDCHPIPVPNDDPSKGILVNVSGTVTYADMEPQVFNQTFILAQDPSGQARHYFVASDTFRLL